MRSTRPRSDFKLVAEAQRITLAGLFDPMLAVATSDVQPLPHQIRAVYGELLPRTPLRFLLADDPGAGKTIMAGLYIKELLLRDDVKQCLIVAPGGLVEQWQDELFFKFGLRFDLLTNQMIDANVNLNVFESNPLLIARMDQLARNEELQAQLKETEWDLIIVDEAHRMGAHYFGGKLEKTKRFLLGEMLGDITRHLLLMTATPHSGKEEDFQLFLTLLDRDRFEGKSTKSASTLDGVMRRMVKEDLLTFEGKKLFPERIAETVPYELTALGVRPLRGRHPLRPRGHEPRREARRQAQEHRRLRPHRAPAPPRFQPRGDLPESRTPLGAAGAQEAGDPQRHLLRRRPRASTSRTWTRTTSTPRRSRRSRRSCSTQPPLRRRSRSLNAELIELADLTKTAKQVRDIGTDRKWTELSHDPPGQRAHHRRERVAAQVHHLHRAPRHPRLPPAPDHAHCIGKPDAVQRDPRRRTPRRAPTDHRGVHQEPRRARSCSPPTPPARASTSRPRT